MWFIEISKALFAVGIIYSCFVRLRWDIISELVINCFYALFDFNSFSVQPQWKSIISKTILNPKNFTLHIFYCKI